ncbi:hypothetical protein ABMA28_005304, partial [Loxostege sticticalis]
SSAKPVFATSSSTEGLLPLHYRGGPDNSSLRGGTTTLHHSRRPATGPADGFNFICSGG